MDSLAKTWRVELFAESIGGGPEVRIGQTSLAQTPYATCTDPSKPHCRRWETDIEVRPGTLPEGNPGGDPAGPSGLYRLAVTLFLNSTLGEPGFDLIGYQDGPMIQVENPV